MVEIVALERIEIPSDMGRLDAIGLFDACRAK
jgi:hypothetical protein